MPFSKKLPFHAHFIIATWPLTSASRQSRYPVLINRIHLLVWGESVFNTYCHIIYHLLYFPLLFIIHIKLHIWEQKSKHALLTFVVSFDSKRNASVQFHPRGASHPPADGLCATRDQFKVLQRWPLPPQQVHRLPGLRYALQRRSRLLLRRPTDGDAND